MTAEQKPLILRCPAKLNLSLWVDPPIDTPRGRLHPIQSWMATLTFHDTLRLTRLEQAKRFDAAGHSTLRLDRRLATDAPRGFSMDWPVDADLASRAHQLVEGHVGRPLPLHAELEKRIPPGAGLGGGSANAAAMLIGINQLLDLQLPLQTLDELAKNLGSDVVFALHTHEALAGARQRCHSALVSGVGDEMRLSSGGPDSFVVLILPPFECATAAVYRVFDTLPPPQRRLTASQDAAAFDAATLEQQVLVNDLEPAAIRVQPRLGELLTRLRGQLALPAHLTGSGAACFVLASDLDQARHAAAAIREATDAAVVVTRFAGTSDSHVT